MQSKDVSMIIELHYRPFGSHPTICYERVVIRKTFYILSDDGFTSFFSSILFLHVLLFEAQLFMCSLYTSGCKGKRYLKPSHIR